MSNVGKVKKQKSYTPQGKLVPDLTVSDYS